MSFRVRAARPQDRTQWCELAGRSGPEAEAAWWDAHEKDPSWRLLVAENGKVVGKTAARLLPGYGVQIAAPRVRAGAPVESIARALLESALHLREEGPYPLFEFRVGDRTPEAEALKKAAEAIGFGVSETRVIVERSLANLPRAPVPFACRTFAELDDSFFVPVIERCLKGQRPAGWKAEAEWRDMKSLPGFDPSYAFLATKAGDAFGFATTFMLPGRSPEETVGSVAFLGIVPEKRGNGHATALHNFAMAALHRRGARRYRDVVDAGNAAALGMMRKNGCREVGRDWVYRRMAIAQ